MSGTCAAGRPPIVTRGDVQSGQAVRRQQGKGVQCFITPIGAGLSQTVIRQARLLEYSHREVALDSRVADPPALRLHERQERQRRGSPPGWSVGGYPEVDLVISG